MATEGITVSARVSFNAVDQIADRLRGVDFPIEIALPYQYGSWQETAAQFDEMLSLLAAAKLLQFGDLDWNCTW